jgi:hypothetical protein
VRISKDYKPEACASRDAKRVNLYDPYLDVEASRLVSTDGHVMAVLPVEVDKGERSRYLGRNLLKVARQLGEKMVPAEIDDQEIPVFDVRWPSEQGRKFPEWREVVPRFKRGTAGTTTIQLNARLLKAVADAMGESEVALTFEPSEEDEKPGAIVVQPLGERPEAFGLLMPIGAIAPADELAPGQACPVCKMLLASGAFCPDHGDPKTAKNAQLEAQADHALKAAGHGNLTKKELKGPAVARKKKGRRG